MLTRSRSRLWFVTVLALILSGAGFAIAGAVSLQDLAVTNLLPSSAPALLGPITQAGRKGWECTPERAAAAKQPMAAELPADGQTR